jgi:hypothetical protein
MEGQEMNLTQKIRQLDKDINEISVIGVEIVEQLKVQLGHYKAMRDMSSFHTTFIVIQFLLLTAHVLIGH